MPRILIVLLVLSLISISRADEPTSKPAAPVIEILDVGIGRDAKARLVSPAQAAVLLHIANTNGKILGPMFAVTIKSFVDDEGTNLLSPRQAKETGPQRSVPYMAISPSRDAAIVQVQGDVRPSPAATKIFLEGSVHLMIGRDVKTSSSKNMKLRWSEETSLEGVKFTLASLTYQPPTLSQGDHTSFGFQIPNADGLLEARFLDRDGKVIGRGNPMPTDPPVDTAHPRSFGVFAGAPGNEVTFEIDICKTVEALDIPFKFEISTAKRALVLSRSTKYDDLIGFAKMHKAGVVP